ncbi:Integrase, catalytic core protein [Phytophthora cinnamomi]|uniref:Integrase, catalytic core protein n=1 Tax=Phytophthora cinnamomi TaxID=4785 RepID=UPI00355938FF|nr:Integrase, catalytic core protein [Phytophthora cinnamomi]
MFNRNNKGEVTPDLATVVNVLLGEAETDKACAAEAAHQETVKVTKVMAQHPVPQNPKKKFKKNSGKKGVRYAPNGAVNLISQRLLEKTRWKPSYFDTDNEQLRCKYFDKDGIRLVFKKKDDGFYWMKASPVLQTSMMVARSIETLEDNIVVKWHLKLAHLNEEAMKKMVRDGLADGMDGMTMDDFKKTPLKCMACEEAKAKRMAFKRQVGKRASECGARLMSDVCYVGIVTPGRAKYFQLVQDEASRYKWVFLLNKKSEAAENVIVLVRQLEKDYKSAIAVVANNGNTSRVRHMAKHARFINEYVQEKELDVVYVSSTENCADVFTKALGPAEFERQRSRLNIEDVADA